MKQNLEDVTETQRCTQVQKKDESARAGPQNQFITIFHRWKKFIWFTASRQVFPTACTSII